MEIKTTYAITSNVKELKAQGRKTLVGMIEVMDKRWVAVDDMVELVEKYEKLGWITKDMAECFRSKLKEE